MIVEIFEIGDERRMLIRAAFSQAKDDGISGKMYYNHLRKTQEGGKRNGRQSICTGILTDQS